MTLTKDMELIEGELSNFDNSIDEGVDSELRSRPQQCWAYYFGWNFCGRVWFDGNIFKCEVWCYGAPREILYGETLEELMKNVSDEYGYE